MKILVALLALLLSACGTTGHIGVMHEFGRDPDTSGQNPLCTGEIRKPVTERVSAKYFHQSWCSSGWPFNDNRESTVDAVGIEAQIW